MSRVKFPSTQKIISVSLAVLRSKKFFFFVVALLVLQAAWTALIARYPMAFDENFHFGIIQIYSHQWSPFFSSEPPNSAAYGDLVRNPSYLYHYLMSFPYRLIAAFIHQQAAQIIILRFLNIGLFVAGLFIFRSLLLRMKFSPSLVHVSLLMFVLIPVVPFLAGQINYDNLLFGLVALTTLLTFECAKKIKSDGNIPAGTFIVLAVTCLLSSLVKYAFLPIFLVFFFYLLIVFLRQKNYTATLQTSLQSFRLLSKPVQIVLIISLIIAGGLFAERYGINIVHYKSLQPDCAKLESIDQCLQYGPWARNYQIAADNELLENNVPLDPDQWLFPFAWVSGMMHRLYFAINYDYVNYYALPIPIVTAGAVGFIGILACIAFSRSLFKKHPQLILLVSVVIVYTASLLYVNYTDYLHFRQMLAINGRYLILILPLLLAIIASGYSEWFKRVARKQAAAAKLRLTIIILLLVLQGGGVLTYIVRSDDSWYWQNKTVIQFGREVRHTVAPFIFGSDNRIAG